MMEAYDKLCTLNRELSYLSAANSLIGWDQETYMPEKAVPFRAKQMAYLSGLTHRRATAPEVGDWIKACEDAGFESGTGEAANVREWRHDYDRACKIPAELVEEFRAATTTALHAWQDARKKSDFAQFRPHLEKIVALNIKQADCWGYEGERYDALLGGYERGALTAEVAAVLDDLKPKISALAQEAAERSKSIPADLLKGAAPVEKQAAFNREVAEAIGFDFEAGRIDTAPHPFCSGIGPGDTRMTTRYDENDFSSSLFGVLHESGHGLYDQGLPEADHGLPTGEAISLGIHESQSRLWENHVGRGRPFWEKWLPRAAEYFPHLRGVGIDQIVAAMNRSEPSYIRVEADESTYDLHIILRFGIERRLIRGELDAADVPAAWNEEFEKLFGFSVDRDANGCLQDIHWSMGALGYFPTYTLGNLNAAQLYRAAVQSDPAIAAADRKADYAGLLGWMREHVHTLGKRLSPPRSNESRHRRADPRRLPSRASAGAVCGGVRILARREMFEKNRCKVSRRAVGFPAWHESAPVGAAEPQRRMSGLGWRRSRKNRRRRSPRPTIDLAPLSLSSTAKRRVPKPRVAEARGYPGIRAPARSNPEGVAPGGRCASIQPLRGSALLWACLRVASSLGNFRLYGPIASAVGAVSRAKRQREARRPETTALVVTRRVAAVDL
ncbi:MAG: carboxypeptidase M32 [Verrucomicrobiales bacterium]